MTNSATPDDIFSQVMEVRRALDELPTEDQEERGRLETRLAELRSLAQHTALSSTEDRAELEAHLRRLEQKLDDVMRGKLSGSAAAQTGKGGGIDPEYVHQLNRQIDEGQGVEALREEIARVKRLLEETEG